MRSPRLLVRAIVALALVVALAGGTSPMPLDARLAQAAAGTSTLEFRPSDDWAPDPPGATAQSFVLVDARTGQELAAREADVDVPVASTVKLLTVLTAIDRVDLDETVTVGDEVLVGEASVGLQPGDRWTVRELVEGIVVRSGNDAARALAVHVAGDQDAFVELMRAYAADLGIEARIEEPDGLGDRNRMSARDLAILGRATLDEPALAEIADLESVELPGLGRVETRNLLLLDRPEVSGLKTGFTSAAGYCLVSSMTTDDGRDLVAVVLGSQGDEDRFDESQALLDFGDDDLVPLGLVAGARLRIPGGWVDRTTVVDVSVPLTPAATIGATWTGAGLVQRVLSDGTQVGTAATELDEVPALDGQAQVGAVLSDRLYRVMRAAHRTDVWNLPPS